MDGGCVDLPINFTQITPVTHYIMSNKSASEILLLGMVFSEEMEPKRGQEYRDRVRCEAVEKLGYVVKTLDNKHSDATIIKHCQADFSDFRRMSRSMRSNWESEPSSVPVIFQHVILDYFFSPVGWARTRWTDGLFTQTLPGLATSSMLEKGAKIWLPNLQCIQQSLGEFEEFISPHYTVRMESVARKNPLYRATESVTKELMLCPDILTNETQLRPVIAHSTKEHGKELPWYVLELRDETVLMPSSPQKRAVTTSHKGANKRSAHVVISDESGDSESDAACTDSPKKRVKGVATVSPVKSKRVMSQ